MAGRVCSLDAAAPAPQLRANLRASMTELAAPQISSLMEALPGIAAVLRSPVANAIVALSRAGAGLEEFRPAEAEELLRYGVRRNLLAQDEVDRILAEIREAVSHRPAKAGAVATEKPKKAPIPSAPVSEHKVAASPVAKAGIPIAAARPAPKAPAKPAAKVAVKPVAKAPHKPSVKAPTKALHASKAKKGAAAKSTATARKGATKTAHKKPAAKKGHH